MPSPGSNADQLEEKMRIPHHKNKTYKQRLYVKYTTQSLGLSLSQPNNSSNIIITDISSNAPINSIQTLQKNDVLIGVNYVTFEEMGIALHDKSSFGKVVTMLKELDRPMVVMFEREVVMSDSGIIKGDQPVMAPRPAPLPNSTAVPIPSKNPFDKAPEGSSIMYLAWLDLPLLFLKAIDEICPEFSKRLRATKIGASSSIERFLHKMNYMQMYFPFAKLKYRAFVIPPGLKKVVVNGDEIELDGFVAESAFHYLFMPRLLAGEWFDLDNKMKQLIETRLVDSIQNCFYVDLTTEYQQQSLSTPQRAAVKGWVYFASYEWCQEFTDAITYVGEGDNQDWKNICDNMLAVKLGCTTHIERDSELEALLVDYDSDEDVEVSEGGRGTCRGAAFIWATSQLADTEYSAFHCNDMFREEKLLHNNYQASWSGSGEWYNLDSGIVSEECVGVVIHGKWERKNLCQRRHTDENRLGAWIRFGLVKVDEIRKGAKTGWTKIKK